MLSLERVSKTYWRGVRRIDALCEISLELEPGEFVAVHGGMGAGKTTLLRVAAGIELPDSGGVRYRGRDLATMTDRELARYRREEVGFARPRSSLPASVSVLDYVAIPLFADREMRQEAHRRAHKTLERVGLECWGAEQVAELSGGERRRVELAQALIREPSVLLADEPASDPGLNLIEGDQILALLQTVARDTGAAVMITSADVGGAMRAKRIVGLDQGRLITPRAVRHGDVVQFPRRAPGPRGPA